MRLFNQIVAACRGNHLLVVDIDQARDFPDRSAVTPKLIGVNDLWDIVFTQEPGQEGLRSLGVAAAELRARSRARPPLSITNVGPRPRSYTPHPDATGNPVGVPGGAVLQRRGR